MVLRVVVYAHMNALNVSAEYYLRSNLQNGKINMPQFSKGNIFDYPQEYLKIVTTNGYVKKNGELVMGRGAALAAKNKYPDLPMLAGNLIRQYPTKEYSFLYFKYGFVYEQFCDIGLFQVKYYWQDEADLDLIVFSVEQLRRFATLFSRKMVMNFPAIGNGGRTKEEILPLLAPLPDTITICEL